MSAQSLTKSFKKARRAVAVVAVLALLAALLPAVPAWAADVTTINISNPTSTSPKYVKAGETFTVQYTTDGQGTGYVRFSLVNATGTRELAVDQVTFPVTSGSKVLTVPADMADGTYDLKVEAREQYQANWYPTTVNGAVIVDSTPPSITASTLTSPNGGENWKVGTSQNITWRSTDISDDNLKGINLYYSTDGGANWTLIEGNKTNDGTYSWTVPGAISTNCKVKIEAEDMAGNKVSDVSDGTFTIYGVDNSAPTVSLTAPANNAWVGGTYSVTANASDSESGIASVRFEYSTDNGSNWTTIGTATSSPYSVSWSTASIADGATVLVRATATNGVGVTKTSDPVTVRIDNSAPTVSLTAPANNAWVGGTYTVTADASDSESGIASVRFEYSTDNGSNWTTIGTATSSPYSVSWSTASIADGTTVLVRATATNNAGVEASDTRTVTVDNSAPSSTGVTAPAAGAVWKIGTTQEIKWNPFTDAKNNLLPNPITIKLSTDGGTNWTTIAANEANDGTYTWVVSGVPSQNCKIKIEATDTAGNTGEAVSDEFTIWGQDTSGPTVALSGVNNNDKVKGTVTLNATASDSESGIARVKFEYSTDNGSNWTNIGTDTSSPYSVNWDTTSGIANGTTVMVRAVATNGVGAEVADVRTGILVDNSPPSVTLQQIPNNLIGATCTIKADASDNESGIASVKFQYSTDNGNTWSDIGTATAPNAEGYYHVTWNVPLADGTTGVQVRATAVNGVGLESAPSTATGLTVDKTPPSIKTNTLASPNGNERWARGSKQSITWTSGDITDNHLGATPVSLYYSTDGGANWTPIAADETNDGTYDWVVPAVISDKCRVKIEVRDQAGNVASDISDADFTIYAVEQSAPDVTVNSPNGGESYTPGSSVVITWTAADDTTPRADLKVDLYYSTDGGATWTAIATNEANDGAYAWTVPSVSSSNCLVKVEARDAVGNVGYDISDRTFSINAPATPPAEVNTVALKAGWNLVSLPLIPKEPAIDTVLAGVYGNLDTVWGYDTTTGTWSSYAPGAPSTLTQMRDGRGYWVKVNNDCSFAVDGVVLPMPPQVPPSYELVPGWNLIGFKSTVPKKASEYLAAMAGKYTVIYGFDAATQRFQQVLADDNLQPGKGYWVAVTDSGRIYP
ncbi:Ig-like domain-containing protein [Neomoorella thermoacetica]|uniref:Glycosyl hydrolase, BNR repeat n=1 Tax=Moorella thermoacetica (strain ATCC 39073 / JCM 9320) TaxID=264732 RepID=Q2RLW3_MOOTA|nr:Ig-like domain-containing protein [Moorella thermoacetica]AKX93072.1 chitodextrinase precursor [Moorella thermoacetica]AKX95623.1 chitodextrinase precursor [Moorella thermoacetica]OIQ53666.1 chitodextrinase precursor [Moorella thermoacetica]QCZ99432.1 Chitodextrinase precursor [Moorella thermoacetica]TYL07702.1 hypothetical protein MOOCA_20480 [Moorella thermoacetica]